jgi:hypothetical protein
MPTDYGPASSPSPPQQPQQPQPTDSGRPVRKRPSKRHRLIKWTIVVVVWFTLYEVSVASRGDSPGVAVGSPLSMLLGIVFLVALLYGVFMLLRMAFRSGRNESDRDHPERGGW